MFPKLTPTVQKSTGARQDANGYKTAKEAFVSNQNGSSIFHVLAISSVALCSLVLYAVVKDRVRPRRLNVFTDYTILVLPLLLSMTGIGAEHPLMLGACILIIAKMFTIIPPHSADSLPSSRPSSPRLTPTFSTLHSGRPEFEAKDHSRVADRIRALTVYRSHMLLMTFLAILAVDFSIFPRNLVKCETFGISLMDIGVGSFVFSQGITSARTFINNPSYLASPIVPKLRNAFKKVLPIILLGVVRVILVKGSDYPEHVSEYGVHWNFFLSMAVLPLMEVILHPLISQTHILYIGLAVTLTHQLLLSNTYLQEWTLNAPRTNIISQNKEGIVSLPGYLAIHILGLLTGTIVLPASPSDFKRLNGLAKNPNSDIPAPKDRPRQPSKTAIELCSYAIFWWFLLWVGHFFNLGQGVSRRLANTRYVLWTAAYNTAFLTAYVTLDIMFYSTPSAKESKNQHLTPISTNQTSYFKTAPSPREPLQLLHAINKNGLALFLVANAATGLINLSIKTMYASDTVAYSILIAYSFGLSMIAWVDGFWGRRINDVTTTQRSIATSAKQRLEKEEKQTHVNRKKGIHKINGKWQGRILPTSSRLFKLIIPLPKSTPPTPDNLVHTVYLLHPSQPLSHISSLIAASLVSQHVNISFRSVPPDDAYSSDVEVEWSDATDLGDFIKSVVSGEHFNIVISPKRTKTDAEGKPLSSLTALQKSESPSQGDQSSKNVDTKETQEDSPGIIITVKVPSFQDSTRFLRRRLQGIDAALSQMEPLKQECDREAHRGARRLAVTGFGTLVVYWVGVARLTFYDYGWDIMEPITYLSGLSTVICGYLWFLYKGREVSYTSVLSQSVSTRRLALYKAKGFDLERWADLITERKSIRREVNKIAEDYDIHWDGKWEDDSTLCQGSKNEEKKQIKERTVKSDAQSHTDIGKTIAVRGDHDGHEKLEELDREVNQQRQE